MFEYGAFVLVADEGKVLISQCQSQGEPKRKKKITKWEEQEEKNTKWIACIRKFQTKINCWTSLETDENQNKICDSSNITPKQKPNKTKFSRWNHFFFSVFFPTFCSVVLSGANNIGCGTLWFSHVIKYHRTHNWLRITDETIKFQNWIHLIRLLFREWAGERQSEQAKKKKKKWRNRDTT